MSAFNSLEIGKKALLAQRFGLDITSNNIANVNTPGYSRRTAILGEDISVRRNGFFMGNGVIVQQIQSYRSDYYDREIRNNESRKAAFEVESQFFKRLEITLNEPNGDTFDKSLTDFFKAFAQLSNNTESIPFRNYLLEVAQNLTQKFNTTAQAYSDLRLDSLTNIKSNTQNINKLIQDIANLNQQSANNVDNDGELSQQFIDNRESKLQELSKLIDIKVTTNEDRSVNIFMNGINVLSGTQYSQINYQISSDPITNESTVIINKIDPGTGVTTKINVQSGEIFSNMKMYNETFDPLDTSGNFSAFKELNDFVNKFATSINDIFVTGFGLNDNDPLNPPKIHLFDPYDSSAIPPANPSDGITATNISINADLFLHPENIPLSSVAGEPGNAEIARQIANLMNDTTFNSGITPIDSIVNYISRIANNTTTATNGLSNTQLVDEQLNTQRESLMGVNLDEEAINLIKYQKAFEAAARVINTTDELLSTVINLGR